MVSGKVRPGKATVMVKRIEYDAETMDYAAYLGDTLVGFFNRKYDANLALDELIIKRMKGKK